MTPLPVQAFFCPQCAFPITRFHVQVGANGYHMEAVCDRCQSRVQGIVESLIEAWG
jgi:hypothetical protein